MNFREAFPGDEPAETEISHGSIEAKELIDMLAEMSDREESIASIIEEALNTPIPDQDDQEGMAAFNHKMAIVKELIPVYISRSELLLEMRSRIDRKIEKANTNRLK